MGSDVDERSNPSVGLARRKLVLDVLAPEFAHRDGSTVVRLADVGIGWRVVNAWTYQVDDEQILRAGGSPGTERSNVGPEVEALLRSAALLVTGSGS